ncbi:MAG TPA: NUDIX domain-containing protein [Chloroflexia bacterium]|nr:NUDIX domain-containing protein [Chloroflexia bacterium]
MEKVRKVLAYVTREREGMRDLLIFAHRDYPEAGLQVPAGTVKEGEEIEAALLREVTEETGLATWRVVCKLGVYDYWNESTEQWNERHVFHLAAADDAPDHWQWVETGGGEVAELEGYVFQFRWIGLEEGVELAGSQGDYLDALRSATSYPQSP